MAGKRDGLLDALAAVEALFAEPPGDMKWPEWCDRLDRAAFRVRCANGGALLGGGRIEPLPLFWALETWVSELSAGAVRLRAAALERNYEWIGDVELSAAVNAVRELRETRPGGG